MARIIGPVRYDPDMDGLAGMGWLIPFLDTEHVGGKLLWHTFDRLESAEYAAELHRQLIKDGAFAIDSTDAFTAACRLAKEAYLKGQKQQEQIP